MLNKKMIFMSLYFAFLCLHAMGFSLDIPQKTQGVTAPHLVHDQYHSLVKKKKKSLVYYLYIQDFLNSMISIPTSPIADNSSTIGSKYLAGRAPFTEKETRNLEYAPLHFYVCKTNMEFLRTSQTIFLQKF
jgi:hypothetical protein